jgi:hypothetical protein
LPSEKIGAFSVCTTAAPGENASDHFVPFEAVNASALVVFSTRIVNFVGLSPFAEAAAATLSMAPTASPNIFVNTSVLLLLLSDQWSKHSNRFLGYWMQVAGERMQQQITGCRRMSTSSNSKDFREIHLNVQRAAVAQRENQLLKHVFEANGLSIEMVRGVSWLKRIRGRFSQPVMLILTTCKPRLSRAAATLAAR